MSRLAAYLGPDITLGDFMLAPPNSLFHQARDSQEAESATFNADGFGIGWYHDQQPQRYIMTAPIWHDGNLPALADSMQNGLWLGVVRSDAGSATPFNAQPHVSDALLFMHDGFVEDFNHNLKPASLSYLSADIASDIHGNSDSEYLFALLRQRVLDPDELTIEHALADILANLQVSLRDIASQLNIVLSDGQRLIAARHATNYQSPSLYYSTENPEFPGGQLIASEPLDETGSWEPVLEHHILILEDGHAPKVSHI